MVLLKVHHLPVSTTIPNTKDFKLVFSDTIDYRERSARNCKLVHARHLCFSSNFWIA